MIIDDGIDLILHGIPDLVESRFGMKQFGTKSLLIMLDAEFIITDAVSKV